MSGVTRTIGPLHFEDLEPRRFEDLVRQLVYDFRLWRALEATGRSGSDDGFDARGFEISDVTDAPSANESDEAEIQPVASTDRLWLIQCKREQRISPSKMRQHLDAIAPAAIEGLYGILFVACCDFSKTTRDTFRDWCRSKGIGEAHVWGKAELEDQLFQPKNDGLLFAYFGISLRIRRRSVKTDLRSRLAMKRKAVRILQHWQPVLLRDPTEDRYPYIEGGQRGRWRMAMFSEHHPRGILLEVRRYLGYMADDLEHWDRVDSLVMESVSAHDDPWQDSQKETLGEIDHRERDRQFKFWSNLPERNRANYYVAELVRYEDILDIDEQGDVAAKVPHIYLESVIPKEEKRYLENLLRYGSRRIRATTNKRTKFFPNTFPEPDVEDQDASQLPDDK